MYHVCAFPIKKTDAGWEPDGIATFSLDMRTPEMAKTAALSVRRKGTCVILRPKFNETHLGRLSFREWRSYDGELFIEYHWTSDAGGGASSQTRLDAEIIIPKAPEKRAQAC
jgi:hypothetical protein